MQVAGQATSSHPVRGEAGPQATSAGGAPGRFAPPLRLRRVSSTQELVVEAALGGTDEGLVVVADEQLAGRGRLERRFVAPPGGSLLCSVLFRPALAPAELHGCASAVALAALRACRGFGAAVSLKWPNDLMGDHGKLAGILAELVSASPAAVVVGIGLNCAWPEGWPGEEETAELVAGATTLSAEVGRHIGRDELLDAFLAELEVAYDVLLRPQGVRRTLTAWRDACSTIGAAVTVETEHGVLSGLAREVDEHGALVLEVEGVDHVLQVGDVTHLRSKAPARPGDPH